MTTRPGRTRNAVAAARRSRLLRVAAGVAIAAAAFLAELWLDDAIEMQPHFVLSFAGVLVATARGGPLVGASAAFASWGLSGLVLPELETTDELRPIYDAANVGAAFVLGALLSRPGRRRGLPSLAGPRALQARRPPALADILAGAIDDLAGPRSAAQVADTLARRLSQLSGATTAIVFVRADPEDDLVARARTGAPIGPPPARLDPADPGPLGRALRGRGWVASDERVTIPVVAGSEVVAVVDLIGGGPAFDPQCRVVANGINRLAAEAITRERLRRERTAAGSEASVAAGRISSFSRLASQLAGAVTVERVGTLLVENAVTTVGAEFGLVYVRDPRDGACELVHARGYPVGLVKRDARLSPRADGPVIRAAETGELVEVGSPEAWRELFPSSSDLLAMTGTRALMALPLGDGRHSGGVLMVGWSAAGAPTAEHRSSLAAIADQGAQALERARLHAQEREAQQLQEAFISVISHELRTPITTIVAGSRILRRRLADGPSADLAVDIEAESDRLFRIVEDLLVLSRLERHNLSIAQEPIHLTHLVDRIIASESRRWPTTRFERPARPSIAVVRGEETYVEQILRNLLSNAAKYAPAGSVVTVEIDADVDFIAVRVLDEGPGIARDEVEQLFTLFYRSPATAATAAGAGIGLFVSRRLVDEMGGRMWARNRPEGGAEFGFALSAFPADEDDDIAELASSSVNAAGTGPSDVASVAATGDATG